MKMLGQIGVNIIGLLCLIAAANLISGCSVGEKITFVTREGWSARSPNGTTPLENILQYVTVFETTGPRCNDTETCATFVSDLQKKHMDTESRNDIGYNFLIGGDNKVYDGTGWDVDADRFVGELSRLNPFTIFIGFIGTYKDTPPPDVMVDVFLKLTRVGRAFRHFKFIRLCSDREISGGNAVNALYDTIASIPGFIGCD